MNEIELKIILVGDSSVGKTSLLLRYTDDNFPDKHISSVGVEFRKKTYEYGDFKIKLQIWDTAGQERFHSITKGYFQNADGILFVYDISEYKSFEGIKNWLSESEESGNNFKKLILGNKCDLKHKINVKKEDVDKFCEENNIEWLEVSAKENKNIKEAFHKIIELILRDKTKEEIMELYRVKNSDLSFLSNKNTKRKGVQCC